MHLLLAMWLSVATSWAGPDLRAVELADLKAAIQDALDAGPDAQAYKALEAVVPESLYTAAAIFEELERRGDADGVKLEAALITKYPGIATLLTRDRQRIENEALDDVFFQNPEPTAQMVYDFGLRRFAAGDLPGAAEALARALSLDPTNVEYFRMILTVMVGQGDIDGLAQFISQADERGIRDEGVDSVRLLAALLARSAQMPLPEGSSLRKVDIEASLDELSKKGPALDLFADGARLFDVVVRHQAAESPDPRLRKEIISRAEALLLDHPTSVEALEASGAVLKLLDEYDRAGKLIEKAIKKGASAERARLLVARLQLVRTIDSGDPKGLSAAEASMKKVKGDGSVAPILLACERMGLELARLSLGEGPVPAPATSAALVASMGALEHDLDKGDPRQRRRAFALAVTQATLAVAQGDGAAAEVALIRATNLEPGDLYAYLVAGQLQALSGNFDVLRSVAERTDEPRIAAVARRWIEAPAGAPRHLRAGSAGQANLTLAYRTESGLSLDVVLDPAVLLFLDVQ